MTPVPLDHWVNDNNPPAHLQYGKGWWDYIETLRRLVDKFNIAHVDVVATYSMRTPPPVEGICMHIHEPGPSEGARRPRFYREAAGVRYRSRITLFMEVNKHDKSSKARTGNQGTESH
jgi:hypothetical protein